MRTYRPNAREILRRRLASHLRTISSTTQKIRRMLSPLTIKKHNKQQRKHPGPASSRLSHLHWLPVRRQIQYKVALLTHTYKSLLTNQPPYLRNLLHVYQPLRCLRSDSQNLLCIPSCTTNFSRGSLSFSAPILPFGTNYPPLYGRPTHWTHLNVC